MFSQFLLNVWSGYLFVAWYIVDRDTAAVLPCGCPFCFILEVHSSVLICRLVVSGLRSFASDTRLLSCCRSRSRSMCQPLSYDCVFSSTCALGIVLGTHSSLLACLQGSSVWLIFVARLCFYCRLPLHTSMPRLAACHGKSNSVALYMPSLCLVLYWCGFMSVRDTVNSFFPVKRESAARASAVFCVLVGRVSVALKAYNPPLASHL